MRIAIVGAGSVGRSIARELLDKGHAITLVDRTVTPERRSAIPEALWVQGDAAELGILTRAEVGEADVMVAATGDDKVNLVVSLLAKTEFGVPRTVARVSHPDNEWMFGPMWGVDVAVSTPRMMTALVEEAVSVGRVVKIFNFAGSRAKMVEITLPRRSPVLGRTVGSMRWPGSCVLVGIIRDGRPIAPTAHDAFDALDELLFIAQDSELVALQSLLAPRGSDGEPGGETELPQLPEETATGGIRLREREASKAEEPEHPFDA
ncbi:potassium channel family protein [Brachybacterium phenoliresistens]|uniref:Trk system potassium uptake protein TrkA n=1 Tax=Brachybacterium phenoliresistens TaxID=396014 RepID=Z9JWW9_9MICO|nr:NAD-binding protein [Brachybacterium phenoliresistens]EWS82870.1 potassium transporter TrkA [Brachybacterium phenoliresistens]